MTNDWDGIEETLAIAETGSFIGASRKLGVSPSHISRALSRLESRLGDRLFERTTRMVRLTATGRSLLERFRRLVEDRNEALQFMRSQHEIQGELRITCSIALGERFIEPLMRRFMALHPKISVWMELTNRVVDVVGESYDIAIRTGHPADDRVLARQIASRSIAVCASPEYLARHGIPLHPSELHAHQCLVGTSPTWHFLDAGHRMTIVPNGRWRCNSGFSVVEAALNGLGLCQLPEYYVVPHFATGALVPILGGYQDTPEPIWAVFPDRRTQLLRIRSALDFLEAEAAAVVQ